MLKIYKASNMPACAIHSQVGRKRLQKFADNYSFLWNFFVLKSFLGETAQDLHAHLLFLAACLHAQTCLC